jgi:hypothetical protein
MDKQERNEFEKVFFTTTFYSDKMEDIDKTIEYMIRHSEEKDGKENNIFLQDMLDFFATQPIENNIKRLLVRNWRMVRQHNIFMNQWNILMKDLNEKDKYLVEMFNNIQTKIIMLENGLRLKCVPNTSNTPSSKNIFNQGDRDLISFQPEQEGGEGEGDIFVPLDCLKKTPLERIQELEERIKNLEEKNKKCLMKDEM